MWASDSRVRLRVISTSPSCEAAHRDLACDRLTTLLQLPQHLLAMLALHVDEVDDDDAAQVAQPQLARDGVCAASRLVLKIVSSKLRAPTKPPVLTSMVVSASVWSMTR
jgi:hypothetical protein